MSDQTWKTHVITEQLEASAEVKKAIREQCLDDIIAASSVLADSFQNGGTLLCCGNGGSAADAQHIATELVVRMGAERPGIRAMALTTDTSILTAASNDYSFERVFARQVEVMGHSGDVLLAISTSGNSPNVISAAKMAHQKKLKVVVFTGKSGGNLQQYGDVVINIPSLDTQRIQEGHITVGHILCALVEQELFEHLRNDN